MSENIENTKEGVEWSSSFLHNVKREHPLPSTPKSQQTPPADCSARLVRFLILCVMVYSGKIYRTIKRLPHEFLPYKGKCSSDWDRLKQTYFGDLGFSPLRDFVRIWREMKSQNCLSVVRFFRSLGRLNQNYEFLWYARYHYYPDRESAKRPSNQDVAQTANNPS